MEKMNDNSGLKKKKIASACDVEALKKCLQEHKGDYNKCQSQIEAFKSSCSINNKPSESLQYMSWPQESSGNCHTSFHEYRCRRPQGDKFLSQDAKHTK
ncbi:hypothetical protein R6Q59_036366 [Mikania micrantha]